MRIHLLCPPHWALVTLHNWCSLPFLVREALETKVYFGGEYVREMRREYPIELEKAQLSRIQKNHTYRKISHMTDQNLRIYFRAK